MFLTTILNFFYNVFKNLPFLDRQKSTCLVLKLTWEVSISSLAKNSFNHHSLLPLQCFQKPSLSGSSKLGIVWHSNLHERYQFPPWQKTLLTTILSFLYNVFKSLPFLDRQNSGLFGTQTYTRGIDVLLSKKAMSLICQYGVYGQRLVFNRIDRSRNMKKKLYCTPLSFEEGNESM